MDKKTFILDTETNAIQGYTKLHCLVLREVNNNEVHTFRKLSSSPEEAARARQYIEANVERLVGHNLLGFDCGVLSHFGIIPADCSSIKLIDTLVVSRMLNYNREGGHSLEAWGEYFGVKKSSFDNFEVWSQELEDRCILDTEINLKLYKLFEKHIYSQRWQLPLEIEHFASTLCNTLGRTGIGFNLKEATSLFDSFSFKRDTLSNTLRESFPPKTKKIKEITPKATKAGVLHSKDFRWLPGEVKDLTPFSEGASFSLFEYESFNPGSPIQRVQRLNEAGWKPISKTDGHIAAIRNRDPEKIAKFRVTGWKTDEENLATLPPDAPEGARKLREWILLDSRLGDLKEWISLADPVSGRINGTFTNPGSWSMRVSHQKPNLANIPAVLDRKGQPSFLGKECRELFVARPGYKLVGVDADSIQLRVFAHLCEDLRLIAAIENGKKEEKSDIHHLNYRVMHPICTSREVAKTLIYAILLGAGIGKVKEILNCTKHEAETSMNRLMDFYPGWKKLVNGRLEREGRNGYIECLDGRYLPLPDARRALAGHLQSGEKIIMAKAAMNWSSRLASNTDDFCLVNWVHDEWQTEVKDEKLLGAYYLPELVGQEQIEGIRLAGEQLNMKIKLTGNMKIGNNWAETH